MDPLGRLVFWLAAIAVFCAVVALVRYGIIPHLVIVRRLGLDLLHCVECGDLAVVGGQPLLVQGELDRVGLDVGVQALHVLDNALDRLHEALDGAYELGQLDNYGGPTAAAEEHADDCDPFRCVHVSP